MPRSNLAWAAQRFWRAASVVAVIFAATVPARAQSLEPTAPDEDTVSSESVVVTAPSVREMVRSFVGEVSNGGQHDQLGRWDRTVCPGVAGMRERFAQVLIDRMAVIAFSVGLDIGEPGCRPNALIYVTEDSDALARELVTQHGALVSRGNRNGHTRGRRALEDFASTPRAVRWWHVTSSFTADGFRVEQGDSTGATTVGVRSMGRLHRGTREDFDRVLIIVDARRINGLRFGAVADYVAMATLAQLDPEADTSAYVTILNLFSDETATRPSAITDWDMSYLNGLYNATREARDASQQERDIARRMREQIETASNPTPH